MIMDCSLLITALNPINMATIWKVIMKYFRNPLLDCQYSTPVTTTLL